MDEPILGMEAEEREAERAEGERVEVTYPPLALTRHVRAMVMRRFHLEEEEVKPFIERQLLLAGPGRKRRDGALRWTSEERVQVVTREYLTCTLVLTCYPLPPSRARRKAKKVRRASVIQPDRTDDRTDIPYRRRQRHEQEQEQEHEQKFLDS